MQKLTDNDGVIIDGVDYPIANGWKLRAEPHSIAERFTQLIDPNGSMLLEGFMMEPERAAEDMSPSPSRGFKVGDVVDIGIAPDLLPGTPRITERYVIGEIEGKYAKVRLATDRINPDWHWGYIGRGFTLADKQGG